MEEWKVCRRVPLGTRASLIGLLDRGSDEFFAPVEDNMLADIDSLKDQDWIISGSHGLLRRMEVEPKPYVWKDRTGWTVTYQGQHHHRGSFEDALTLSLDLIKGAPCPHP